MVLLPIFNCQLPIVFNSHYRLSKSEIRQSTIGNNLALRKLEAFACALLSVLLSFLDAWIARHETGVFEGRSQVAIILDQRARDTVSDCAGLARRSAARDIDHQIKLVRRFGQLQWLPNDHRSEE